MNPLHSSLASLTLLALSLPALASGSASSVSLEGSSASVGSVSTSLETSSDASSKGDDVAQGDYRIVDIAAAPARPGALRVTLHAVAGAGDRLVLTLPQETARAAGLAVGGMVHAQSRAHGLEFSHGEPRQAFFLVLRDDAFDELRTRPVTL